MDDALGSMAEPIGDEPAGSDPMASAAPVDDFTAAIQEAFPDNDWTPERSAAMKEAIRLCVEKDEAGGYGPPPGGGKGDSLALIFGEPKKKS
jgi:hypothetical protein